MSKKVKITATGTMHDDGGASWTLKSPDGEVPTYSALVDLCASVFALLAHASGAVHDSRTFSSVLATCLDSYAATLALQAKNVKTEFDGEFDA